MIKKQYTRVAAFLSHSGLLSPKVLEKKYISGKAKRTTSRQYGILAINEYSIVLSNNRKHIFIVANAKKAMLTKTKKTTENFFIIFFLSNFNLKC